MLLIVQRCIKVLIVGCAREFINPGSGYRFLPTGRWKASPNIDNGVSCVFSQGPCILLTMSSDKPQLCTIDLVRDNPSCWERWPGNFFFNRFEKLNFPLCIVMVATKNKIWKQSKITIKYHDTTLSTVYWLTLTITLTLPPITNMCLT